MSKPPKHFTEEDIQQYMGQYIRVVISNQQADGTINYLSIEGNLHKYTMSSSPPPQLLGSITLEVEGLEKNYHMLEVEEISIIENPEEE